MNYTDDWDDGHYNVIVGYDSENFFFMDPWTKEHNYAYIPKTNFGTRWHDLIHGKEKVHRVAIFVTGTQKTHPVAPVSKVALYEE
jgi:hypothetical protein